MATARERQAARIAELARLATVAQEAVLRPIGPQVGSLAVAGRYVSASAAADIGGDLYEALDTPYGVRMIIGDVRGKGIDAVRLASIVLGAYRHVAFERADLRAIVGDLDRAVARSVGEEDFVTAALVEERGGTLTVVNCGHPSPLLMRRGRSSRWSRRSPRRRWASARGADPGGAPRTGRPAAAVHRRAGRGPPGRRVLPDHPERAWALLGHGTVEHGLASLESALVEWVRGQFDDDIALLLLEYTGPRRAEPSVPSWEIGAAGAASWSARRRLRPSGWSGPAGSRSASGAGRRSGADTAVRAAIGAWWHATGGASSRYRRRQGTMTSTNNYRKLTKSLPAVTGHLPAAGCLRLLAGNRR